MQQTLEVLKTIDDNRLDVEQKELHKNDRVLRIEYDEADGTNLKLEIGTLDLFPPKEREEIINFALDRYQEDGYFNEEDRDRLETIDKYDADPDKDTVRVIVRDDQGKIIYHVAFVRVNSGILLNESLNRSLVEYKGVNQVPHLPTMELFNDIQVPADIGNLPLREISEPSRLTTVHGKDYISQRRKEGTDIRLAVNELTRGKSLLSIGIGIATIDYGINGWLFNFKADMAGQFVKSTSGYDLETVPAEIRSESYDPSLCEFYPYFQTYGDKIQVTYCDAQKYAASMGNRAIEDLAQVPHVLAFDLGGKNDTYDQTPFIKDYLRKIA